MSEEKMRLAQPKRMTYVHVHDNTIDHGSKKWILTKYVQMYPHLYTPVQYNGINVESEMVDVTRCH
jgi:hypothetical protein